MKKTFRTRFKKVFDDSCVKDGFIKRLSPGNVESDESDVAPDIESVKKIKKVMEK